MTAEPLDPELDSWCDVARFVLRNWRDEIAALLRAWRGWAVDAGSDGLRLEVILREVTAHAFQDGASTELGRFEADAAGAAALAARLDQADLAGADVALRFDDASILRSAVRLPQAGRGALLGAVGFELERLSPIPPAELYYDVRIGDARRASKVDVAVRALRRRLVDEAVAFAHAADLAVAEIALGDDVRPADWRRFPVDRAAWLRRLWARWGSMFLAGLAIVLTLALVAAITARSGARLDALDARIAQAQLRADAVARLENRMDAIRAQSAFVARRKEGTSFLAAWAALTQALPDGTWLTNMQVDGGRLHIQGYSKAASDLVERLDRSGHFQNAQFGAPLVRNDSDGTERFDLTARVAGSP